MATPDWLHGVKYDGRRLIVAGYGFPARLSRYTYWRFQKLMTRNTSSLSSPLRMSALE
jgi:hypothetical protein